MKKELKQFIKFAYKQTYSTYNGIKSIDWIKNKVYENLKELIPHQNNLGYGYGDVNFDDVKNFINTL